MGLKEERQLAKAAQQQEKNRVAAEKLVMEARHLCYLNSGLDAILLKLNEAIKIDTNSYYAYTMKAVQVYLHTDPEDSGYLQKKEEAQLSINTAFKIKPNSPYVVYNKWKMENPGASSDRVEAAMKRVLSLPAETLLDEIAYAAAHKTCGRKADAIAQYRKILGMKEYAKNFDVLASLAEVLYEEGRFAEAFEIDKIAVKVEPKFAVGFGRLGHSLGELGQHKDAIVAHKRELKLAQTDEDMASAHNGIAVSIKHMANRHLISNKKKYEKALKEALKESEKSIALKPDEVLYFCQAADISNTLGHKAKALGFIYQAGKIQIANGAREEDIASDFIEKVLGQKDQIEEELGIRTQADVNKIIYDLYLAYPELSDSDHSGSDYDVTLTGEAGN